MNLSVSTNCKDPLVSAYANRNMIEDILDCSSSSSDDDDDDVEIESETSDLEEVLYQKQKKQLRGLYHGVYVSADNATVIDITLTLDQLPSLLQCEITDARSIPPSQKNSGRSLIIFCDDMGMTKDLPINSHATALTGITSPIHGPVVIVDEKGPLSVTDLF